MSIRFSIKNTQSKAEKEGDTFLRYSGVSEPFRRISERTADKRGVKPNGDPILNFTTGLDPVQVKFYKWYGEDEKQSVTTQIKDLRPIISDYYGGDTNVDSSNYYFWGENRDVNRLSLTNEDMDVFYDTKNPVHALLYLSLISGAFIDTVAPTRDWAERHQIPHYMALETEETFDEEDSITRSDAHAALAEIRKDASPEALFILAWCIQYDTNAFGAYTKATPLKDLINYHIKYIDGKLVTKKKKNTPKVFIEYVNKWKAQQTRPVLYAEAYIKAGQYFNFINQRTKKLETTDGTILGNTVEEAVANIMKPKFQQDLEKLRDQVEGKWKE